MVEHQKKRLEDAINNMLEDMYKTHLRKIQSKMHHCAAKCCDDEHGTLDSIQSCIEKCASPLVDAQEYLQYELGEFQHGLQSCVKDCNRITGGKVSGNPSERELSHSQNLFERCTNDCVDKHIGLIPAMMKSIKKVLENGPNSRRQRSSQRSMQLNQERERKPSDL